VRVKELTVQGFKSFATKHRFVFPTGITAVVGPNGSGKSNIADAIRWVLGEQRPTSLRAGRVHDMIFAGTERRPRAGLAEVSLTFENADRWLDIDFGEVVVARRVHRDGTSTFLINGAPVRLRDVADLLGSRLGHGNYTVVGQGLVDSALALRPDERRVLIDEAAGLVPLQRKRDHALRQLAETDDNLTRVRDILDDLGPRLKRMARLAGRAERYREVASELGERLAAWYGFHWHRARRQLAAASAAVEAARAEVEAARAGGESAEAGLRGAEAEVEAAGRDLDALRARREALVAADARLQQATAVARARMEALTARRREVAAAAGDEAAAVERAQARLADLRAAVGELTTRYAARRAESDEAQAALAAAEAERDRRAEAIERVRAELFGLSSEQAARRKRAEAIDGARATRRAEREAAHEGIAVLGRAATEGAEALASAEAEHAAASADLTAVEADIAVAEVALGEASAALGQAREAHAGARAAGDTLRARAGVLDALLGEADESAEVLARLHATRDDLDVAGTVAGTLEVEERWEAAVAAALGSRVHGIVVRDRSAISRALGLALPDARGAVTLVALDGGGTRHLTWAPLPGEAPVDEVARSPRAPGLVPALLGDTVFVADLDAAWAALAVPRDGGGGPARAATRDGLLVRRGGVVAGGTPARAILSLERERRGLPAALEVALGHEASCGAEVDRLSAERGQIEGRLGDLTDRRAVAARDRAAAAGALERARAHADRAAREHAWAMESVARLDEALAGLDADAAALAAELAAASPRETALAAELTVAERDHEATELPARRAAAATAAAALAETAQALAGERAMFQTAERELALAEARADEARRRVRQADDAAAALAAELAESTDQADVQTGALAESAAALGPAEARAQSARLAARQRATAFDAARRELSNAESRLAEARIAATRAEDRLERLRDQLRADAEWLPAPRSAVHASHATAAGSEVPSHAIAGEDGTDAAAPPPAGEPAMVDEVPIVEELPVLDDLPPDSDVELASLRRQIRAIGPIDAEALATYEETAAHFAHLTTQRADLDAAEADLRRLIETLDGELDTRFNTTFEAVARAFAEFFPRLFGGGEAELVLRGDGGGPPGLDVVARPPGKRRQPLSLLSGGERALTAVALIFALLRVSETPFVVLDEVDAALDEANVARFCAALESLAAESQVIVVTHNRGTIQTAGAVYGVTMGDDGGSQVISLQVEATAQAG